MTRTLWRLGGSALTVAMLGFGTLQVVSQVAYDRTSGARDVTSAVRVVDVRIDSGSIDVLGDPGRTTVHVRRDVERGLVHTSIDERIEGDTLVIRASCPFLSAHCAARYHLDVPRDVRVLAHADGNVRVAGVRGGVDAHVGQGRVTLVDVTGTLRAHTAEGSVHASDLRSTVVDVSAGEGSVNLGFAADPTRVVAHSSQGGVHVVVPSDRVTYRVDAHASEGSTDVRVPTDPSSDRHITVRSGQGGVTVTTGTLR
jgi:hypothetical protein